MARVLKPLNEQDLLVRFIDTEHWELAHEKFPASPWDYYCKPHGQYPRHGWRYFQRAYQRAWDYANRPQRSFEDRVLKNKLTVDLIIELNSLLLFGEKRPNNQVIRQFNPVFRKLSSSRMQNLFFNQGVFYKNPDGLEIKVEGFLSFETCLFVASLIFEKISTAKTVAERKRWCFRLKNELHPKLSFNEKRNYVWFLLDPEQIMEQLNAILKFYEKECRRILENSYQDPKKFSRCVGLLALKMQRYLDMTHLAPDATSRTSRLIEEFIYWQFGFASPEPIPVSYAGAQWHRSAYLPLTLALKKLK